MIQTNIYEAKTHLSNLVDMALAGKKVIISKRNIPLVEIKPIAKKVGTRMLGQAHGKIKLTKKFDEPLPDDVLKTFNNPVK